MVAVTRFFNNHVLGPDRMALLGKAMPAANDFVRGEHEKTEAALRRKVAELDSSMDNLMRVLERERDPEGQLYRRTKKRMGELETELHEVEAKLRRHVAAKPEAPDDNVSLLEHLPTAEVHLGRLAGDRLQRFLSAFRVEIHYDCRTRRGTFRAEISGNTIDQLTDVVRQACEEPEMIMGSRFGECPRQDSNLRPRLRRDDLLAGSPSC